MKYRIRTVFLFVFLVAIALAIYQSFFAPPVLRVGMSREVAVAELQRANAADMLRLSTSSQFAPEKRKPQVPSQRQIDELVRFSKVLKSVPYSKDNFETYWYLPTVGRFETHFEDGKLALVTRWDGHASENLESLRLEFRPDNPYENAGIPGDF